ncbi:MAG: hypothetical protein K8T89_12905 [Planctomycetes bacterium]|nr:hypothetical protein [Planctomycetota bacterium]
MLFILPLVVVWSSLTAVLLLRWVIGTIRRHVRPDALAPISGRGMNWYYAAVLISCVVVPLASAPVKAGRVVAGPTGMFMVGLYVIGIILFIAGQVRSHKFAWANAVFVPIIFIALAFAVGLLWLQNFGSNFSV